MKERDDLGKYISIAKIEKVCERCGKKFEILPHLGVQKFCSRKCFGLWTVEDIEFLKSHYELQTGPTIAKKLRKSLLAVRSKARKLSLRKRSSPSPRRITYCKCCGREIKRCKGKGLKWGSFCSHSCMGHHLRGKNHPMYKGRTHSGNGYVYLVIEDSEGSQHRLIPEHRVLYEKFHGITLAPQNIIHHKDGNPKNNTIDNLVFCEGQKEHMKLHKK